MPSHRDYADLIQKIEESLRQSGASSDLRRMERMTFKDIPREFRVKFAQAFRRSGMIEQALRVLTPVIKGNLHSEPATAGEKVEYAFALKNIGSLGEAEELLGLVKEEEEPKKLIALVHCYFNRWNYGAAVPLLRRYLELVSADKYQHLVAMVNLAAAQVHLRDSAGARETIELLKPACAERKLYRILGNLKEVEGELLIQEGRLGPAESLLKDAAGMFSADELKDALWIKKWLSLIESLKAESPEPLYQFKSLAQERKHWESVRASDLLLLEHGLAPHMADVLYYGTPYDVLRDEIDREYGPVSAQFDWNGPTEHYFCLATGKSSGDAVLNPGKRNHRMLDVLSRDFYRPIPQGALFAGLFPDEKFNIFSSPNRIHQSVARFRKWLEESGIPLQIEESSGEYRMIFTGPYSIRKYKQIAQVGSHTVFAKKIQDLFGSRPFTRKEAQTALQSSLSGTTRALNALVESGELTKVGGGTRTQYQIAGAGSRKKAS